MYRKSLFIIFVLLCLLSGCKTKKAVVVNAKPEFNAEEVWTLTLMQGREVVYAEGQSEVTLQINTEAGTFNGINGCNKYMGDFKDFGDGRMALSNFNGTKKLCPEPFRKIENNYMQLLHKCDAYRLEEYTLYLLHGDKVLLTFEKVN